MTSYTTRVRSGARGRARGGANRVWKFGECLRIFYFFPPLRKRTDRHDHRVVPIRGGEPVADAGENALSVQLEGHIEST